MDRLNYWRACTDFTVVQAALIVCGFPPDNLQYDVERNSARQPEGYIAIRTAFQHALNAGKIKPSHSVQDVAFDGEPTSYLDIQSTTISVEEIDRFLKSVGIQCDFFDRSLSSGLAQGSTSSMPVKLAAAVKAWTAVTAEPKRLRGRSPKQALEQWLVENAADLGLLKPDGEPNRTGIEEICKVANWKPAGGAPSTPTSQPILAVEIPDRPLLRLPLPAPQGFHSGATKPRAIDFDDDIPF